MGCLLKMIISSLVSLAVVVGIVAILAFACTPNTFGLGGLDLGFGTLEELGLADKNFATLFTDLMDVFKEPKEEDIVTNGFDDETEAPKAENNLRNSAISSVVDGETVISYADLLSTEGGPILYDQEYLLRYDDHTLGYIFNQALKETQDKERENSDLGPLGQFKIVINEVSLYNDKITVDEVEQDSVTLKVVASFNIAGIKEELFKDVPGFISNIIPSNLYVVSQMTLTATNEGVLSTASKAFNINGKDSQMSEVIIKALAHAIDEGTTDETATMNSMIGGVVTGAIAKLGRVGTATVNSSNVVTGDINLGNSGIKGADEGSETNGYLTLITSKQAA